MTYKKVTESLIQYQERYLPLFIDADDLAKRMEVQQRENVAYIEQRLYALWKLGEQIILTWCLSEKGIDVLYIPYYLTSSLLISESDKKADQENIRPTYSISSPLIKLIKGTRYISPEELNNIQGKYDIYRSTIELPHSFKKYPVDPDLIDNIVKRYSISYIENRAVALFDIDGFTKYSAFDQVTLINSLAYSINSAHEKMLKKDINIDFARSNTGDGFYVWNRAPGLEANINLYHLMHLVLADNAITRNRSNTPHVPSLKTAFHIGDCYEFYQTQGLSQTIYSYIVGDVTIELARLIEHARPGQIIVGDFQAKISTNNNHNVTFFDSIKFIKTIQPTLDKFRGVELSGDKIEHIKCYFTGRKKTDDSFDINVLKLIDKHEIKHLAYNAKVNIYREHGDPIFLGIQENELSRNE